MHSRLLIVEDARHVIDELRDAFAEGQLECEVVLDVQTARDILGERHMDIAVIDARIVPGGAKGIPELIGQFRALAPLVRIVVFNGVTSQLVQRRMRRLGAAGYLSQKSDIRAVIRSVRKVAGEHSWPPSSP